MAKFKVGDRVRVRHGAHAGELGVISQVDGDDMPWVTLRDVIPDVCIHVDRLEPFVEPSPAACPRPSDASVRRNTTISIREGVIRVWDRGGKQVVRCPVALWPIVREAVRNAAAELDAATKEHP